MTSAVRVLLGVVKWVVIPAGLGFAGYYFIGPQFSKAVPAEFKARAAEVFESDKPAGPGISPITSDEPEEKISTKYKPPKVSVKVLPANGMDRDDSSSIRERSPEQRSRSKRRNSPKTVESEPQAEPAVQDPAPTDPPSDSSGDTSQG